MRCRYGALVEQSDATLKEVLAIVAQVLEASHESSCLDFGCTREKQWKKKIKGV